MRKGTPKKRILAPDPKFGNQLITRFVNMMMYDGKKDTAFKAFYKAIEIVGNRNKSEETDPVEIWKKALTNVAHAVEVKSRRVGGATFQVPMEIRPDRKVSLSIKWMILFARKRSGRSFAEKLAAEILAAYNGEGGAFKKKEDTHRMAEANRAFAHFRF